MVLYDIADCAYLFVENSRALDTEGFGHSDLHAPDIVAVPDRLQKRVGKPEVEQILNWFLAEVMIDSENVRFLKRLMEDSVELSRRGKVTAKRLSTTTRP